jgi:NAD+ diphosphatase
LRGIGGYANVAAMTKPGFRGNFYSGVGLDRADALRRDATWVAARQTDPKSRVVLVWRNRNLIRRADEIDAVWLRITEMTILDDSEAEPVFLGRDGDTAVFAADLSHLAEAEAQDLAAEHGVFEDLRAVGPLMPRRNGAILAYARGLLYWHRRHRFCGICGSATVSDQAGHVRRCTNTGCGAEHFPRTDPAVIMLVHDGDRCVLGRQKIWPPGMHSTLAGFVEPGESLEEAVAREVYEEVGLAVTNVTYESSQPWPFPSSIMLGFRATCAYAPMRFDTDEIESADWFTRAELHASPEDESFRLPRRDSIARRLIEDWLAEE